MTVEDCKNKNIIILNELPKGWIIKENTSTQPKGYKWCCNNKSMFSKEYKSALVKDKLYEQ